MVWGDWWDRTGRPSFAYLSESYCSVENYLLQLTPTQMRFLSHRCEVCALLLSFHLSRWSQKDDWCASDGEWFWGRSRLSTVSVVEQRQRRWKYRGSVFLGMPLEGRGSGNRGANEANFEGDCWDHSVSPSHELPAANTHQFCQLLSFSIVISLHSCSFLSNIILKRPPISLSVSP